MRNIDGYCTYIQRSQNRSARRPLCARAAFAIHPVRFYAGSGATRRHMVRRSLRRGGDAIRVGPGEPEQARAWVRSARRLHFERAGAATSPEEKTAQSLPGEIEADERGEHGAEPASDTLEERVEAVERLLGAAGRQHVDEQRNQQQRARHEQEDQEHDELGDDVRRQQRDLLVGGKRENVGN